MDDEKIIEQATEYPQTPTGVSKREAELIQQIVKEKLSQHKELPYEDLSEYVVPPRTQFSMLNKPAVSIKPDTLTFNMAAVRMFQGITLIVPTLYRKKKRLTCIFCNEEESASVEWARTNRQGKWVNKDVKCPEFIRTIYETMGWQSDCRFKALGETRNSQRGLVMTFELQDAIMFTQQEEYLDRKTGQYKKRFCKYYPDFYKDNYGRSYSDYEAARQASQYEDVEAYDVTPLTVLGDADSNSEDTGGTL